MSVRRNKPTGPNQSKTRQPQEKVPLDRGMPPKPLDPMAVSSSLNSIHIAPRTPKSFRMGFEDAEEGVELSLLDEDDRRQATYGLDDEDDTLFDSKREVSAKDKRGMVLLCILCACGILSNARSILITSANRSYTRCSGSWLRYACPRN